MAKIALWDEFWLELDASTRFTIVTVSLLFWVLFNSSLVYFLLGPKFSQQINRLKLFILNLIGAIFSTLIISKMPTPLPECELKPKEWKSATGITSYFRKMIAQSLDETFRLSWASLVKLLSSWFIIFLVLMIIFSFIFYLNFDHKLRKKLALSQVILGIILIIIMYFSMNHLC